MVWLTDAGSFGVVVAYVMVALSFVVLRYKEPDMPRPYKVKNGKLVGMIAVALAGIMALLYVIPIFPSALVKEEWMIVGLWVVAGVISYAYATVKYGSKFGAHQMIYYREPEKVMGELGE